MWRRHKTLASNSSDLRTQAGRRIAPIWLVRIATFHCDPSTTRSSPAQESVRAMRNIMAALAGL
jgi:hypothetical protein